MAMHVPLSRRVFLRLSALTAAATLAAGCVPGDGTQPGGEIPTFSPDQVADTSQKGLAYQELPALGVTQHFWHKSNAGAGYSPSAAAAHPIMAGTRSATDTSASRS